MHSQVQNLREERINLLEQARQLREDKDMLTKQLSIAAMRVEELQGKADEADAARAKAEADAATCKHQADLHEAMSSQLRAEAGAWQTRLTQAESEHMRKETTEQIEKTRTAEQMEHERSRLLGDIATLGAERRHAEEQWRQTGAALDLNTPSRQQCMQCLHE